MVVCGVAMIPETDVGKTLMNMEMLKFLRARASKIIHCVVFNKVVHIIHSSRVCRSPELCQTIVRNLP